MITSCINNYYFTIINDILTIIKNSRNGKRRWYIDENGDYNYSLTTRSTYPEYFRFYFIKTPKKLSTHYSNVNSPEPWIDGYFNGNRRELLILFTNALKGKLPRTKRLLFVFDYILMQYLLEVEEIEYYSFDNEDFEEFPF